MAWFLGLAAIALATGGTARAEDARTEREPGPFRIRTVDGDLNEETVADRGVMAIHGRNVTQTLTWQPLVGPLSSAALDQRTMVLDAARANGRTILTDGIVARDRAAGRQAVRWTAKVDAAWFVGSALDCPRVRVLLVTAGPTEGEVERIHRQAIDSLDCVVR